MRAPIDSYVPSFTAVCSHSLLSALIHCCLFSLITINQVATNVSSTGASAKAVNEGVHIGEYKRYWRRQEKLVLGERARSEGDVGDMTWEASSGEKQQDDL